MIFLWLSLVCPARAHGPFDHSTPLIVGEARMQLAVTLSADATREFAGRAGLPPERVRRAAGQTAIELLAEVAGQRFSVSAGGQTLVAEKASAITEGLETVFTMLFPRPAGSELRLRVLFFNGIDSSSHQHQQRRELQPRSHRSRRRCAGDAAPTRYSTHQPDRHALLAPKPHTLPPRSRRDPCADELAELARPVHDHGGVITAPVVPTDTTRFFRLAWP